MILEPAELDFCRALPKVELHAHLNGSIPEATLMCGTCLVGEHAWPTSKPQIQSR